MVPLSETKKTVRRTCIELSLRTERRARDTIRRSSADVDGEVVIPEVKAEARSAGYLSETEACSCCLELPWNPGTVIDSRCGGEGGEEDQAFGGPPGGQVKREEAAVESQRAACEGKPWTVDIFEEGLNIWAQYEAYQFLPSLN